MHEVPGGNACELLDDCLCIRPSIKKLFTVFQPVQEIWPLGRFLQKFGPFLGGGQVMVLGSLRCLGVQLFCIMVGQGPLCLQ